MKRLRILFAHNNCGQFKHLHRYLNESGLADCWLLCNKIVYDEECCEVPNLIPFTTSDGLVRDLKDRIINPISLSASVAAGIYPLINSLIDQHKIDIFYGHVLFGSVYPYQRDLGIPVVYYVEYPSLEASRFNLPLYKPAAYQIHEDRYFQMLVNQSIVGSSAAIAPSLYTRNLFSDALQQKIFIQQDGFYPLDFDKRTETKKKSNKKRIGFCARYLTYARGLEDFIAIVKLLLEVEIDVEFFIVGIEQNATSYEMSYLAKMGKAAHFPSFLKYLINEYQIPPESLTIIGYQQFDAYIGTLQSIDIFLYPLREGSSNWGFFHLLSIGAVIVASDRCYIPEVITNGVNGYMLSLDCYDAWIDVIVYLLRHDDKRQAISIEAYETSKLYHLDKIGKEYVRLLRNLTDAYSVNT